jgi:hypothetical protein
MGNNKACKSDETCQPVWVPSPEVDLDPLHFEKNTLSSESTASIEKPVASMSAI